MPFIIIILSYSIMLYFNDIKFIQAAHISDYQCCLSDVLHSCYTLEYIAAGSMYYQVDDGARVLLDKPALHWHCPDHVYHYGPVDAQGWDHYFVHFAGERAQRIYDQGLAMLSDKSWCWVHDPASFQHLFAKIVLYVQDQNTTSHSLAVATLEEILSLAFMNTTQQVDQQQRERMLVVAEQIASNPMRFETLEQIAQSVSLSKSHLCRLFKQVTGRTAYDYLLCCRMRHAADLLQRGSQNTEMIAHECGYDDVAQFTKMFQKKIGISPGKYRKMARTVATPQPIT